jgi:DnaJ-class molecular chaperone
MTTPYKTLGVKKTADKEAIRTASKRLAKKHHPDVAGGENEMFNKIKAAYDLLMDDKARKLYDEFGVIPGDDASQLRLQAMQNLTALFMQLLTQIDVSDLKEKDVIGLLRDHINREIQGTEKQVAEIKRSEKHAQEALKVLQQKMKHKCRGARTSGALPGNRVGFCARLVRMTRDAYLRTGASCLRTSCPT